MNKIQDDPFPLYVGLSSEPWPPSLRGTVVIHLNTSKVWRSTGGGMSEPASVTPTSWVFVAAPNLEFQLPITALINGLTMRSDGIVSRPPPDSPMDLKILECLQFMLTELRVMNVLIQNGFGSLPVLDDLDKLRADFPEPSLTQR